MHLPTYKNEVANKRLNIITINRIAWYGIICGIIGSQ